jgi:hypothetical protein
MTPCRVLRAEEAGMSILSDSQLTGLAQREIQQLLLYDALDAGPAVGFAS